MPTFNKLPDKITVCAAMFCFIISLLTFGSTALSCLIGLAPSTFSVVMKYALSAVMTLIIILRRPKHSLHPEWRSALNGMAGAVVLNLLWYPTMECTWSSVRHLPAPDIGLLFILPILIQLGFCAQFVFHDQATNEPTTP